MVDRTFLFSDVEGSTRAWESDRVSMAERLAVHDRCLSDAVTQSGGTVVKHTGDGLLAVFESAGDAVAAAVGAQLALTGAVWPQELPLRARIGLHSGPALLRGGDWFGPTLNRCARLMAAGHGGQVLCSAETVALARGESPGAIGFVPLGEFRLKDLADPMCLVQVNHPALDRAFPPLRTLDATLGNLPFRLPRLIGRDEQLRGLVKEIVPGAAVTVVGPGGIGKTRLALGVAADAVGSFADGAWLIDLSARREPHDVVVAVAEALAVPERAGMSLAKAVCDSVARRRLLVVLDSCEHLLEPVAELVEALLAAAPGVAVLATSREPLGVSGELVRLLGPLTAHGEEVGSPAFELFVERAHQARADLDVTHASTEAAIVDICRSLDGLPLAIELAAGRCAALHPVEIARRLGDRLKLLTGGRRTAAARHRTLTDTIDWSFDLLDGSQQTLFRRLGVFTGSFSLDAAETVAGHDGLEVVDRLGDLVAKSLVAVVGTRYRLLETLREYAATRLHECGEWAAIEVAEKARCLELVHDVTVGLKGPDETLWADLLAEEMDNIRACWRRSVAVGDAGSALGCFAALPDWSGLAPTVTQELAGWARPSLSLPGAADHPLAVGACLLGSRGRYNAFDRSGAQQWLDRAESTFPVPPRFAAALATRRALLAWLSGSKTDAIRHMATAKVVTDGDDLYEMAYVEAFDLFMQSETSPGDAAARYPKALAAAQLAGSPHLVMFVMTSWAELLLFYARPARLDQCRELAEDALQVGAQCRNPQFVNSAISKLAADGRHPEALQAAREFLIAEQRSGYHQQLWWHLRCLLIGCHNQGLYLRCAQLTAAVYNGPLNMTLEPTSRELEAQELARQALGSELYDQAGIGSQQLDVDDLIRLALDVIDELLDRPEGTLQAE